MYRKVKEGDRVGRLVLSTIVNKSKNGSNIWLCICDCGNTKQVQSSSLNSGLTQSCGCLYEEVKGKQAISHGRSGTKTYHTWCGMKRRCIDANCEYFYLYGGRGISVCPRWINGEGGKSGFECFYEDMGERPEGMSIDRIDTNENYTPENCRWSSNSEQGFNTRKHSNNTSGRSGVSYHKLTDKWQASIGFNNKQIYLGLFSTIEEACVAREKAELEYFGFIKECR